MRASTTTESSGDEEVVRLRCALTDAFPYYDHDNIDWALDTCKAGADRLAALIRQIDPDAPESDGFWETFYWDVAYGDFATTDVLGRDDT